MKKIFAISLTLFFFASCTDNSLLTPGTLSDCDHVTITITNQLDLNFSEVILYGITYKNISKGAIILEHCEDEITIQDGTPLLNFTAIVDGKEYKSSALLHRCGVGMGVDDSGTYHVKWSNIYEDTISGDKYILYTQD